MVYPEFPMGLPLRTYWDTPLPPTVYRPMSVVGQLREQPVEPIGSPLEDVVFHDCGVIDATRQRLPHRSM